MSEAQRATATADFTMPPEAVASDAPEGGPQRARTEVVDGVDVKQPSGERRHKLIIAVALLSICLCLVVVGVVIAIVVATGGSQELASGWDWRPKWNEPIVLRFTFEGEVYQYQADAAVAMLKGRVANASGVNASDVNIVVAGGSVVVDATITPPNGHESQDIAERLRVRMASRESASAALGLNVTEAPELRQARRDDNAVYGIGPCDVDSNPGGGCARSPNYRAPCRPRHTCHSSTRHAYCTAPAPHAERIHRLAGRSLAERLLPLRASLARQPTSTRPCRRAPSATCRAACR